MKGIWILGLEGRLQGYVVLEIAEGSGGRLGMWGGWVWVFRLDRIKKCGVG